MEAESHAVLADPQRSQTAKKQWVIDSRYNQRLYSLLGQSQQTLLERLGMRTYARFVDWIEGQWALERQQFSPISSGRKGLASLSGLAVKTYPRSFEVYATRYDAGDRKIVALPDKCLKFANGGALQCDGYAYGLNYSVAISYEGNLVVALVGESGPWNVDDNYWAKASDPQPRRMFADLPLGVPEAQAAYFDGYNGGLDQFGRVVTSPVAIDISRALAADLGLGPGNNKVTVSFLWTEGWNGDQNQSGATRSAQGAQPPVGAAIAWETATPAPDGSVTHIVKAGQTLVGIAAVYQAPLADLLSLNGLTMQSIIQPGDPVIIKPADPTQTPTQTATPTVQPTRRTTATFTPQPTLMPSPSLQPSPVSTLPAGHGSAPVSWLLAGIIVLAFMGIGLLAWGMAIRRRNN
jgi:hypothetical protein